MRRKNTKPDNCFHYRLESFLYISLYEYFVQRASTVSVRREIYTRQDVVSSAATLPQRRWVLLLVQASPACLRSSAAAPPYPRRASPRDWHPRCSPPRRRTASRDTRQTSSCPAAPASHQGRLRTLHTTCEPSLVSVLSFTASNKHVFTSVIFSPEVEQIRGKEEEEGE